LAITVTLSSVPMRRKAFASKGWPAGAAFSGPGRPQAAIAGRQKPSVRPAAPCRKLAAAQVLNGVATFMPCS
jgi:hypothetical protein